MTNVSVGEAQAYNVFNDRAVFEYKYSLIPRQCYNTKRIVWGAAVRGRRIIFGPGDPVVEDRWYHRDEGLIMLIKQAGR